VSRKRFTPEQIIGKIREAKIWLSALYLNSTLTKILYDIFRLFILSWLMAPEP
jgi:hypothetical protein